VALVRKVEALTPIEWYDGIVTGFVRLHRDLFLCVLLAFDATMARRRYLLVQIAANAAPNVAFDEFGGFFRSTIQAAFSGKLHRYVTHDEPVQGRDIGLEDAAGIPESELTSLQFPRIDEAVLVTSIARWL
jgi:hypothetical protein